MNFLNSLRQRIDTLARSVTIRSLMARSVIVVCTLLYWGGISRAQEREDDVMLFLAKFVRSKEKSRVSMESDPKGGARHSWADIQRAGRELGVVFQMENINVGQMATRGGNYLAVLKNGQGYMNVLSVGARYVVTESQGKTAVISEADFAKFYTGRAISAWGRKNSSGLTIKNPVNVSLSSSSSEQVGGTVHLKNMSKEAIGVQVWRTSCGCTAGKLSTEAIAPGAEAKLEVTMNRAQWGEKTETILLKSSDPTWPIIAVALVSKAPSGIVPVPNAVLFESIEGKSEDELLSLFLPAKAKVTSVTSPNKDLMIDEVKTELEGSQKSHQVRLTLSKRAPVGKTKSIVKFGLSGAGVGEVSIPIDINVRSSIRVEPPQIFLGSIESGARIKRGFVLRDLNGRKFSVLSTSSDVPTTQVKVALNLAASSHAVGVEMTPSEKEGTFLEHSVSLKLSDGRTIVVPIVGTVGKPDGFKGEKVIRVGQPAPDFQLVDMNGIVHKLSDLKGKSNLLLTFFPKCFTGGCASHLTSLNDKIDGFEKANTVVWAVSVDEAAGAQGQIEFAKSLHLTFPLFPDEDRKISLLYEAVQKPSDMASRETILIDKNGMIRFIDETVDVRTHGVDMLDKISELGMDVR